MAEKSGFDSLIGSLEKSYAKLPLLPVGVKDFLVMIAPWASLIGGILVVLLALPLLGLTAFLVPFMALGGAVGYSTLAVVAALFLLADGVLMLVATPSLFGRKIFGWKLFFWGEILMAIGSLVRFDLGAIVGVAIGLYFLFQVKSYYK